jgi:xanthine/uracil permease
VALGAVVAAAVLMVCSGLIHIHLWDIAYRHVATLGPLFLVQAVAALVLAVVLVVARTVLVALACMALMVGTMVGFILAVSVGIFGFTLQMVTAWAYEALSAELLSSVVLGVLVLRAWRVAGGAASGGRDADHGRVEVTAPH